MKSVTGSKRFAGNKYGTEDRSFHLFLVIQKPSGLRSGREHLRGRRIGCIVNAAEAFANKQTTERSSISYVYACFSQHNDYAGKRDQSDPLSIAMEELSLSHILNAEGEKIQHVLGTLTGQTVSGAGIQDLLSIDESVMAMMESVRNTQNILLRKMETALGVEPEPAPKPEPKPEPKQ